MSRIFYSLILFMLFQYRTADAAFNDLVENLDSMARAKLVIYPQNPGSSVVPDFIIEDGNFAPEFMYSWATWMQTDSGIRLDTSGWFEYGLPNSYRWTGGFRLFQDDDIKSRPIVLNELFVTVPVQNLDLLIGRSVQHNTLSVLYPLADRYIARDFNDPLNAKIFGVWQARADYYQNDWQYTLSALPVFQPSKVPGIESRWWIRDIEPIIGEPIPDGATGRVERDIPNVSVKNTAVMASIKTHQQQWDAFSTIYHGYAPYSVTRINKPSPDEYVVTQEYVPGFDWSAGLSTTIESFELHTEALYHHTYSGKDDDFINALVGFIWQPGFLAEWLNCNQVHLIAEYAREHILSEQDPDSGFVSSSSPFRLGKNTLFTECLFEVSSRDSIGLAYVHNFSEPNAYAQISGGRRYGNGSQLELVFELFWGDDLYFGTWDHNNRLYLNYEYNF
ncbi:hypothetical protein P4B35_17125 [Pontiellaceae bacterium B12227]|nr:hypothetical protein [Pontiellaceae bacterium B12227]